jgi:hypothetical protein
MVWFGSNLTLVAGRMYLSLQILVLPATVPASIQEGRGADSSLHTCAYILGGSDPKRSTIMKVAGSW